MNAHAERTARSHDLDARSAAARRLERTVASIDWELARADLDQRGYCVLSELLTKSECSAVIASYGDSSLYRSRIVMARHNFGLGEYQYYAYPLPPLVDGLRHAIYPQLAPLANQWATALGLDPCYPQELAAYLQRCHAAGQTRPTPLILRYEKDGYNCLHQDLYGALHFPMQVAILLSAPEKEFTGGELVLTEQRPRMQSRAQVLRPGQGDGVIFAVNERPVSALSAGTRHTLGIIFHDAA
jgi:hypothetical protein